MKTIELKLTRIGNSRGVRLPVEVLQRYGFQERLSAEVREDGLLLKPKRQTKLSWTETAHAMAAGKEDWGAWDRTTADGLESCPWEPTAGGRRARRAKR